MAIHQIQAPDGQIHEIEAPDNATPEQVTAFFQSSYQRQAQQPLGEAAYQAEDAATKKANEEAGYLRQFATGAKAQMGRAALGTYELAQNVGKELGISPNTDPEILAMAEKGANAMDVGTGAAGFAGNLLGDPRNYLPAAAVGKGLMGGKILASAIPAAIAGARIGLTEPTEQSDSTLGTNLSNSAIGGGLGAALGTAVPVAGKAIKDAFRTIPNLAKRGVIGTPELGQTADQWYKVAENSGALYKPEAMQGVVAKIRTYPRIVPSTEAGKIARGTTPVDGWLKKLDKIAANPVSLRAIDEVDGALQNDINVAARTGDKQTVSALKTMQTELRDASNSAKPENMVNPEGFKAWRNGDKIYAAKMKSQQIDDIMKTSQTQQEIKTKFKALERSINKYGKQGWTDAEIKAISQGARTGAVAGALSTIGGKIISGIGGAAAGIAGGGVYGVPIGIMAAEAAAYPMRGAAKLLQGAKATEVQRLLGNRPDVKSLMTPKKLAKGGSVHAKPDMSRVMKCKDNSRLAYQMFSPEIVKANRDFFFNKRKPYTVGHFKEESAN